MNANESQISVLNPAFYGLIPLPACLTPLFNQGLRHTHGIWSTVFLIVMCVMLVAIVYVLFYMARNPYYITLLPKHLRMGKTDLQNSSIDRIEFVRKYRSIRIKTGKRTYSLQMKKKTEQDVQQVLTLLQTWTEEHGVQWAVK